MTYTFDDGETQITATQKGALAQKIHNRWGYKKVAFGYLETGDIVAHASDGLYMDNGDDAWFVIGEVTIAK